MEVIEELVDELCPQDCIYRLPFTPTTDFCGYCLIEHETRHCKISECDKCKVGKRKVVMEFGTLNYKWVEDENI